MKRTALVIPNIVLSCVMHGAQVIQTNMRPIIVDLFSISHI